MASFLNLRGSKQQSKEHGYLTTGSCSDDVEHDTPALLSPSKEYSAPLHSTRSAGFKLSSAALLLAGGFTLALLLILAIITGTTKYEQPKNFIAVEGTQFIENGRPFYIAGFNLQNIAEAAYPTISRRVALAGQTHGQAKVRALFKEAALSGFNVVRTWGHTTLPDQPLMVSPGKYSEEAFVGLDTVIAEASRAGLRVTISFIDNWKYHGGIDEMIDWSQSAPDRDPTYAIIIKDGDVSTDDYSPEQQDYEFRRKSLFFTDPGTKQIYMDHMAAILNRKNAITGFAYKDDPTILSFNLLNEHRCFEDVDPSCSTIVKSWIAEMAKQFHVLDGNNHLLTVGEEGFYGKEDHIHNPGGSEGSTWASMVGQDYIADHSIDGISYAAFHLWPSNWNSKRLNFTASWISQHISDAAQKLKKPVVLEEYGVQILGKKTAAAVAEQRDPAFRDILRQVEKSLAEENTALAGSAFWRYGFSVYSDTADGEYDVTLGDSTYSMVAEHAVLVKHRMNAHVPLNDTSHCWVPTTTKLSMKICENRADVCRDRLSLKEEAKSIEGLPQVELMQPEIYPSKVECCRPGLGAWKEGCSTLLL